ncbi:heterokaryon incompatibility protein-domain-containing protein [Echria macrotheca]|uniref:Heterokaryon incompatibility protein-domain-containing protein n=1 Tax=Echria macrotheca TaxID=438768 RepID=A0AAJ0BBJ6_9PEZI|nr:heterokaryon incompatibility protein-domain-containing protein [Echria macrotheca]
MRLLDTTTFELQSFVSPPRYAILSHTWDDEEILFEDAQQGRDCLLSSPKKGLAKLIACCAIAARDGYGYVWIDTCCIDKSSSAELSEAINSMFGWYANSQVCYVHLADCQLSNAGNNWRWFTRGWTLQELVAPYDVRFYNADWSFVGTRFTLADEIFERTGIDPVILRRHREPCYQSAKSHYRSAKRYTICVGCQTMNASRRLLDSLSVATRMSWVANRETTRDEDMAYCVMGIFDVNMPLLYGEGRDKAFVRLQEAIINRSNDQSILVWGLPITPSVDRSSVTAQRALAMSPGRFGCPCEPDLELSSAYSTTISSCDLILEALVGPCSPGHAWASSEALFGSFWLAFLNCSGSRGPLAARAIVLSLLSQDSLLFQRVSLGGFHVFEACPDGVARGLLRSGDVDETVQLPFDSQAFKPHRIRVRLVTDPPHLPYSRGFRRTTPPVQVQVVDSADGTYTLQETIPPIKDGNFIPPSPDPFMTTSFRYQYDAAGDTKLPPGIFGALIFSSQQKRAFVVLCGLTRVPKPSNLSREDSQGGVDIRTYIAYGWWQETLSSPFCVVMSWESFVAATGRDDTGTETGTNRLDALSLIGRVRSLGPMLNGQTEILEEISTVVLDGGFQVEARLERVKFLQRQSMCLAIKISR